MDAAVITAVMQGSAMVVLAYHFLVGLPAILERIAKDQAAERIFWAGESAKDRQVIREEFAVTRDEIRRHYGGFSHGGDSPPKIIP